MFFLLEAMVNLTLPEGGGGGIIWYGSDFYYKITSNVTQETVSGLADNAKGSVNCNFTSNLEIVMDHAMPQWKALIHIFT